MGISLLVAVDDVLELVGGDRLQRHDHAVEMALGQHVGLGLVLPGLQQLTGQLGQSAADLDGHGRLHRHLQERKRPAGGPGAMPWWNVDEDGEKGGSGDKRLPDGQPTNAMADVSALSLRLAPWPNQAESMR